MALTVVCSRLAFALALTHNLSGIRIDRAGVLLIYPYLQITQ